MIMDRAGDKPVEERVNEGESLEKFFPESDKDTDMVTALRKSAMRQWIYFGEITRRTHQSTSRDSQSVIWKLIPTAPDDVIPIPIIAEHDGVIYMWDYRVPVELTGDIRRHYRSFLVRNQRLELNVERTCDVIGVSRGHGLHEEVRACLEQEAAPENVTNQILLQIMYGRILSGEPIFSTYEYQEPPQRRPA